MIGKVPPSDLAAEVLPRTGEDDSAVRVGPAYGEDAAAIEVGGETLVVSTDPVSLATGRIGTLAVHIAANDIAASGGDPRWLTVVLFLPDRDALEPITRQLDDAAGAIGGVIVGGHSEFAAGRDRPLLVVTAMGLADRFVSTGGAEPGDRVVLAGAAGIEATAILATDFRADLDLPAELLDRGAAFFDDVGVLPAARAVRDRASAMHDPTEGGLVGGLFELAAASGTHLEVEREAVPVREGTRRICGAAGVDPLRTFGSGALVATVPDGEADAAVAALEAAGIEAADIGAVRAGDPALVLDGEVVEEPVRDGLYPLFG
ncbi:MAG: AIR synthase-related protein [Halobacteriales archaeon]